MNYLDPIDATEPGFGTFYDELPLWSAPFGLLLLQRVPLRREITVLDVGAGTGFLTLELAQRCGASSSIIAVDPWRAGVQRLRQKLDRLGLDDRLGAFEAHVQHRGTVDSVQALLAGAGFEILGVTSDSFQLRYADGSSLLRHHSIRLGFIPGWKSLVPAESVERTFSLLEQRLNAFAAERGELALTIPMACVEARRPEAA